MVIRSIFAIAIALVVIAPAAHAQAPTPAQIEKAKKAFGEGKKAFDAGDFPEAIQKFKESYNLSKNPKLLYNVAIANESAGQDDIALFYYRKFLTDAAPDDAQRPDAETRKKALEVKFSGGGTPTPPAGGNVTTPPAGGTTTTTTTPTEPPPPTPPVKKEPVKCKPPGSYQADAFKHQIVDIAPPKKTLDITSAVPEDSCFVVTLHFRTSGESKFTAKEMKPRYNDLVGRIPPAKMIGDSIQYYLEVKDSAGTVVTRSGKSTSPNLVELQAGAPERYFPDFSEEGEVATPSAAQTQAADTEEDPLNKNKKKIVDEEGGGGTPVTVNETPGNGFRDVGSSKFKYTKWGTTIGAVGLVGLGVVFHISAGNQARFLEDDVLACGAPPCREFDAFAKDVEAAGKRNQTLSRVSFGVGGVAVLVAGYFWYKELTAKKRGESRMTAKASPEKTSLSTLQIAPALPVGNDGFTGISAGLQF
ncbi:MAG: hypothetical protein ACKV2T_03345 [Kofleriaceae bacterium]